MPSNRWHITRTDSSLTLSRRLPAQFDVAAETVLPAADPLRLAHQIRQDMWRKLQGMRGFSPVVEVTATGPGSGQGLRVRAGGQVMGRAPSNAAGLIADVLESPANRARWQRHAVRRRDKTCPEAGPKTNNPPEIAAKFDKGNESVS